MDIYAKIVLTVAAISLAVIAIASRQEVIAVSASTANVAIIHNRITGTACLGSIDASLTYRCPDR
jgi:hypothetical protein